MVLIEKMKIGDIPLLHVVAQEKNAEPLPFVIFVHGFESAKENNLHYAYLLAEKGLRVVLPEASYHGDRTADLRASDLQLRFWEIILTTIEELSVIKTHFEGENLIDPNNIGVAGTSMGGIITFGALTKYKWIKAATVLMGMPYYEKFAHVQINELKKKGVQLPLDDEQLEAFYEQLRTFDISLQPEKLADRPLLIWHGKKDRTVPYTPAYDFYRTLTPYYEGNPEKLQFISDDKADHKVSREGVLALVQWFHTYLT